ncbi:hypothetical protein [Trichothermofontia sp.]
MHDEALGSDRADRAAGSNGLTGGGGLGLGISLSHIRLSPQ